MNALDSIVTKGTRRGIYWALLTTALGASALFVLLVYDGGDFPGYGSFTLLRLAGASIALLLIWSAVFIRNEPSLARSALVGIGILHLLFFARLTALVSAF